MNIVLFGFMGVGKTTVGRLLAPSLGYRFVDSDMVAERVMRMKISTAFHRLGEEEFRTVERRVIRNLVREDGLVIALGGGAVLDPRNVETMRREGKMVLLTASPEEICRRTLRDFTRPLLMGEDRVGRIRNLLEERLEKYLASADVIVDTNGVSPLSVAKMIKSRVEADC